MSSKRTFIIIISLIAAFVFTILALDVGGKLRAAQNPEEEFNKASEYLGDGRYEKAISMFQKIIQENPGTDIAARCHFELAGIYGFVQRDDAKMLREYQTVAIEYKNTPMGFEAECYLINCHYLKDVSQFVTWMEKINELIVQYGGISVYEILKSNNIDNDKWEEKLQSIPQNYRDTAIPGAYAEIGGRLNNIGVDRTDDYIKLQTFVRTYFPQYFNGGDFVCLKDDILINKGIDDWSNFPDDKTPPVIRPIAPRENNTIGDRMPKIEVELDDGDISQFQIDTSKLIFTLDGQDLIQKASKRSHINKSGQLGPVFETIRLRYRPENPLAPGSHTVYVKALDFGGQTSEKTWSFTIK